ncbi:hypothetical protein ABI59_17805 [Acidobacteria bacterium Mor1]|nr:hypothetical protein ABI59_17805 [Acidobacteria bacterium Mor1]
MTATTRKTNQGTIVEVRGALTIGDGTLAVGDAMDRFIASCDDRILIDLSEVSALDSAGVRVLVQSALRARDAGVPLGLVTGGGRVRRVLDTLNLQACIPTYENLAAGLECLATEPVPCATC